MSRAILLIDDDDLVRESLRRVLENKGFSVTGAGSGEEAIRLIDDNGYFDLIISDIRMPNQNGVEVVKIIQEIQKSRAKQSSFIFITGYADDDVPQYAARLGVTEFVLKPFDIDRFISTVEHQLEDHHDDNQMRSIPHLVENIGTKSVVGKWKFPNKKFISEKIVLLKETNLMGNTYFANYVFWQGEAREKLLLCHPCVGEWMENNKHIKMITHSTYHRFLSETTFGDVVRIEFTTREIKKCSFIAIFRFFNAKTNLILGEGWQRICFSDVHTGKLCPIPQLTLDLIEPIKEDQTNKVLECGSTLPDHLQ